MPNGNGKTQPRSPNTVHVGRTKQAMYETTAGWLPAVIVICQQPDGGLAVICGPGIDAQSVLMATARGLRLTELREREPQATMSRRSRASPS